MYGQFPLFVSDECVSELVAVASPLSADVGGDRVGAVQSDGAVGEMAQTAEHGLELWNLFLQRGREGRRGGEGRGGEGRGEERGRTGEGRVTEGRIEGEREGTERGEGWVHAHSMCTQICNVNVRVGG